jgi:hypothetical protein
LAPQEAWRHRRLGASMMGMLAREAVMRETGLGDRPYGALVAAPELGVGRRSWGSAAYGNLSKFRRRRSWPGGWLGPWGLGLGGSHLKGVFCRPLGGQFSGRAYGRA